MTVPLDQYTRNPNTPITVADLAANKRLPVSYLTGRDIWLHDEPDGVAIPYFGSKVTEKIIGTKIRTALSAKDGSYWPKGKALAPYGLWRLKDAQECEFLIAVEGESDAWTLWYHDFPALGIPGANAAKVLDAKHLTGIQRLYVFREPTPADKPGTGGDAFINGISRQLKKIKLSGVARVVTIAGIKDPNDLHRRDPARFRIDFQKCLDAAVPMPEPMSDSQSPAPQQRSQRRARIDDGLRPIERVIQRLQGVTRSGDTGHEWTALCPAHGDSRRSLSVGVGDDDKVLLCCHAGCTAAAIVEAIDLTLVDLFAVDDDRQRHDTDPMPGGVCGCEPSIDAAARRILSGAQTPPTNPDGIPDPSGISIVPTPAKHQPRKTHKLTIRVPETDPQFPADPVAERCHRPKRPLGGIDANTGTGKRYCYRCHNRALCEACWQHTLRMQKIKISATIKAAIAAGQVVFVVKTATAKQCRALAVAAKRAGGGSAAVRQIGGTLLFASVPADNKRLRKRIEAAGGDLIGDQDRARDRIEATLNDAPRPAPDARQRTVTYSGCWRITKRAKEPTSADWLTFEDRLTNIEFAEVVAEVGGKVTFNDVNPTANVVRVTEFWVPKDRVFDFLAEIEARSVRFKASDPAVCSSLKSHSSGREPEGLERFDDDFRPQKHPPRWDCG